MSRKQFSISANITVSDDPHEIKPLILTIDEWIQEQEFGVYDSVQMEGNSSPVHPTNVSMVPISIFLLSLLFIVVYDVEMRTITLRLEGHIDDINAVCFADPLSTNVLFSGSDDSVVKVWDRRSMAGGREAGCLLGHLEGITYVASKGDGRYLISNGKDQTLKLWDIRKMMERSAFDALPRKDYCSGYDYRWMVLHTKLYMY